MHKNFLSIKEAINNEPQLRKIKENIKRSDVVLRFYEIFPELQKVVTPIKVEKGSIFLHVENSVWRSEIIFKEELFVSKINKFFKEDIIKHIKFK